MTRIEITPERLAFLRAGHAMVIRTDRHPLVLFWLTVRRG